MRRCGVPHCPRRNASRRCVGASWRPLTRWYVNDNFLDWKGGFADLLARCGRDGMPGAAIVALLAPGPDDRFVLKPRHSGFLDSPLELLLRQLHVRRVTVCGIAADACILVTAHDAHMRGFEVHVPRDCVAAQSIARRDRALAVMRDAFGIDIRASRAAKLARE